MGFRESVVQFQCAHRSLMRFGHDVLGWNRAVVTTDQRVGISEGRVGPSVAGILMYGLLKVVDCLLQTFRSSLVPEILALKIKVVSLQSCGRKSSLNRRDGSLIVGVEF